MSVLVKSWWCSNQVTATRWQAMQLVHTLLACCMHVDGRHVTMKQSAGEHMTAYATTCL